ncbi:EthD domain-containing protein [Nemania abortiva]|nr:EthD domain-containing protein [Nemania abortiva]
MPYSVLIFSYRKPGTTPEQFKAHYDDVHVHLIRELTGAFFPLSHTRRYLHRSEKETDSNTWRNPISPATVVIGTQEDFDYDAISELTFEDEPAFQKFFELMKQPENQARIAADEEKFVDRSRLSMVALGNTTETKRVQTTIGDWLNDKSTTGN